MDRNKWNITKTEYNGLPGGINVDMPPMAYSIEDENGVEHVAWELPDKSGIYAITPEGRRIEILWDRAGETPPPIDLAGEKAE